MLVMHPLRESFGARLTTLLSILGLLATVIDCNSLVAGSAAELSLESPLMCANGLSTPNGRKIRRIARAARVRWLREKEKKLSYPSILPLVPS